MNANMKLVYERVSTATFPLGLEKLWLEQRGQSIDQRPIAKLLVINSFVTKLDRILMDVFFSSICIGLLALAIAFFYNPIHWLSDVAIIAFALVVLTMIIGSALPKAATKVDKEAVQQFCDAMAFFFDHASAVPRRLCYFDKEELKADATHTLVAYAATVQNCQDNQDRAETAEEKMEASALTATAWAKFQAVHSTFVLMGLASEKWQPYLDKAKAA